MRKHITRLTLLAAMLVGATATAQAAESCCTTGDKTCCVPASPCCKK